MHFRKRLLVLCGVFILGASSLLAEVAVKAIPPGDLSRILSGQEVARGISYSGYRPGQGPGWKEPSYQQVREDLLLLLSRGFNLLRLYGASQHAEIVLDVIEKEKLPLKVMQGVWLHGEINNPNSPWAKQLSDDELRWNKEANRYEMERAIFLANKYPSIITAVNIGNEVIVDWTDHLVPIPSLITYIKRVKEAVFQPVTVAENYIPFAQGRDEVVSLLDFLTIHSYPFWEKKPIDQAIDFTKANYAAVARRYPNMAIAIGEAGWATGTNGVEVSAAAATEEMQKRYFDDFTKWTESERIPGFFFSAFDEEWKGGPDPSSPEKHWGLFKSNRTPKLAMENIYAPSMATEQKEPRISP